MLRVGSPPTELGIIIIILNIVQIKRNQKVKIRTCEMATNWRGKRTIEFGTWNVQGKRSIRKRGGVREGT